MTCSQRSLGWHPSSEELVAKFAQIMQTDTNTATFFSRPPIECELALNSYLSSVGGSGGSAAASASIQAVPKGSCQVLDPSGNFKPSFAQPAVSAGVEPNELGQQAVARNVVLLLKGHAWRPKGCIWAAASSRTSAEPTMRCGRPSPGQFASTWRLSGGYWGNYLDYH